MATSLAAIASVSNSMTLEVALLGLRTADDLVAIVFLVCVLLFKYVL
jgi:hypothetical protein